MNEGQEGNHGASTLERPAEPPSWVWTPQPTEVGAEVDEGSRISDAILRGLDLLLASMLTLLLLPALVLAAAALRLDSRGPLFYRAERVGFRGRPLHVLKFRKMRSDAAGPSLTAHDDDRFTRLGRLYAKLKIDEIPQLWNVLRGDMSLVGPRPEAQDFVQLHLDSYRRVLSVRPGVTGLSQIAFVEESRILDSYDPLAHYTDRILPQKVELDMMFAERRSVRLYVRILFWTLATVALRRPVAVHRQSGAMNLRRR